MTGFGIFSFLAAGLQLIVPSYAFRLVRRFGAQRVGWFVVMAFCSLALLYLLRPMKPSGAGATLDVICIFASGLLVIGMGHLETLCSDRLKAESDAQRRRNEWQAKAQEQTADLAKENQELVAEIARREQRERTLKESERQYRFLFAENPLPMWIFDLRSYQFLAVNQAALRHYGFSNEEFAALTARELMPAETSPAFLLDAAKPCHGAQARGVWRHRRKDLTLAEVEITAVDMKFADRPARLGLLNDVAQHRRRARAATE